MAHYFEEHPEVTSRPALVPLVLPDVSFRLTTDRGVFSTEQVDSGTRILLETVLAPPGHGDLLDLGCGYGPIALTMAARAPQATVWALDVNERALELCRANAAAAGLTNVRAVAELPSGTRLKAIWSNPPIRIGKPAMHELLTRWLDRLDGSAHLVVHKHLGSDSLQKWLVSQGYTTRRVVSRSGYRVLEVKR